MGEIKNMTCFREVETKLNTEIESLNKLGTGSFARKIIRKLRARLFGECLDKLDLKEMKDLKDP